jgi:hypothetical protein
MEITPQSQQYGLPQKEARELPTAAEISDLLSGPRITPGLMRSSRDESAFDC